MKVSHPNKKVCVFYVGLRYFNLILGEILGCHPEAGEMAMVDGGFSNLSPK